MKFLRHLFLAATFGTCLGLSATNVGRAVPDNTLGMALMGGRINFDGTFHGSGIVSVEHTVKGNYQVDFNRDVADCFATATGNNFAIVIAPSHFDNSILFLTTDGTANTINAAFDTIVLCPK